MKYIFIVLNMIFYSTGNSCNFYRDVNDTTQLNTGINIEQILRKQLKLSCEPHIMLSGPETNSSYTYWAQVDIRVEGNYRLTTNADKNIRMKAGEVIVLKPKTSILRGNMYLARIENCSEPCETTFEHKRFFTPNNDGVNEYWNLSNTKNMYDIKVYIYDRFGKLLHIIRPGELGWDGKYNSHPILATDYWFKATYKDCIGRDKIYKSHFSLLR
jgi:gliding motility-associated-like protein